jgi:hypothetical protein
MHKMPSGESRFLHKWARLIKIEHIFRERRSMYLVPRRHRINSGLNYMSSVSGWYLFGHRRRMSSMSFWNN